MTLPVLQRARNKRHVVAEYPTALIEEIAATGISTVKTACPSCRSVSIPTGMRASAPRITGTATRKIIWVQGFANWRSESLWHSRNATNVSASKERERKRLASV
jgi:hypothetical protein